MRPVFLIVAALICGCAPLRPTLSPPVDCKEFSIQLPTDWRPGKNIVTADGVHLVTIKDARETLVNLYVYPRDSLDVATLNDWFFNGLSADLNKKGKLSSEERVEGDLFGRRSVLRRYTFTMDGGTVVYDVYTQKKVLEKFEIGVLIHVRDRHRRRSLRDLPSIIDSISEIEEAQPGATDNPDDAQRLREDH